MKAIAFAMKSEAEGLLLKSRTKRLIKVGVAEIQVCEMSGIEYILLITGMGKVNSASSITSLCLLLNDKVDEILNGGIGGSLDPDKAPLFSAVISSSLVQHDVDSSAIGDPVGFVSTINKIYFESDDKIAKRLEASSRSSGIQSCRGTIASGDQFVADSEQKLRITQLFHPICVDMESAAMAQVAYTFSIPFAALRIISDASVHGDEYLKNKGKASELLTDVLIHYLLGK